jgi:hypothetical protein
LESSDEAAQLQQLVNPQSGSTCRRNDERILADHIRPCGWKPPQPSRFVLEVDPVLAPGLAVVEQSELPTTEGMKGVGYPEKSLRFVFTGCIWQISPRGLWSRG